jgi:hypothetical protein
MTAFGTGSVSIRYLRFFAPVSPLPDSLALPVLLKMGNDVSTDEILLSFEHSKNRRLCIRTHRFDLCRTRASNPRNDWTRGLGQFAAGHGLTEKQVDMILAGGLIDWPRKQRAA